MRGKEGKIRNGIDHTSSLIMAAKLNYTDVVGIVYDLLTREKINKNEDDEKALRQSSNQLKRLKITSRKFMSEFENLMNFIVDELKKDFFAKKKDLYDENGFLKLSKRLIVKVDAVYIESKIMSFYQLERTEDLQDLIELENPDEETVGEDGYDEQDINS